MANNADKISQEEINSEIFFSSDKDMNGSIDVQELKAYTANNDEYAREFLKLIDTNNDGKISLDEFVKN